MYALILNGAVAKYPYPVTDARRDNPNVSFPAYPDDDALKSVNAYRVQPVLAPSVTASQVLVEGKPVLIADKWIQVWSARDKTPQEIEFDAAEKVPRAVTMRQARLALLGAGKLNDIAAVIAGMPSPQKESAQIEWEYSTEVRRNSPLIDQLAPALGLSPTMVDVLFTQAGAL